MRMNVDKNVETKQECRREIRKLSQMTKRCLWTKTKASIKRNTNYLNGIISLKILDQTA